MITDAIIGFLTGVAEFILDLLPDVQVPTWMSADGPMGTVFGYAGSMGAWFPVSLAAVVLSGLLVCWGVAFGIKIVRIVASFFTAGGGSAA